jgi:hypothetical protein
MRLAVFHEFGASDAVKQAIASVVPLDQAPEPNALAKTEEDKAILSTNAKLFFEPETAPAEVDDVLLKLIAIGLDVMQRNPITSAGCPMTDRVILKLRQQ